MRIAEVIEQIVLVEGESDRTAVLALARKLGRDLVAEHVAVVSIGGATNIESTVGELRRTRADADLIGLCDENERRYFERALAAPDIFVCHADLEDELIRAIGLGEIENFIAAQDELKTFRTYQKQPVQRAWTLEQQVHRFCGTRGGRKIRYAEAMIDWLAPNQVPQPLRDVLDAV